MATRRLEVQITGDARKAKAAMGDVESRAGRMRSKLNGIAKGVAVGIAAGGVALAVGVVAGLKSAYTAALESRKISRETERVVRTTGKAAGVSAKYVGKYAGKLSMLTGVDDELIQSGENLLLTFTNVQNKVGKGNKIFDQATALALDMSTALGTDMKTASIQVGKALNDPIKGITALSKAGVSFTDQQKEQIKTLVESGDTLGAQKIILKELAKEFGGAAKAASTPMDKLKVAVGNVQEAIGGALIPVVEKIAGWLSDKLPGAIEAAKGAWATLTSGFTGKDTSDAESTILKIRDAIKDLRDKAESMWEKLKPALEGIANFLKDHPEVALATLATVVGVVLANAFFTLAAAVWAALGPIGLFVIAVAAVAAGAAYLYQNNEGFRGSLEKVANFILQEAGPAFVNFASTVGEKLAGVIGWVERNWPRVQSAISTAMANTRTITFTYLSVISQLWSTFGTRLISNVGHIWGIISGIVGIGMSVIRGVIQVGTNIISGHWGAAWDAVTRTTSRVWAGIRGIIGNAVGIIRNLIGGIGDVAGRVFGGIGSAIGGSIRGAVNSVIDAWNRLEFTLPSVSVFGKTIGGGTISTPNVPRLHTGGTFRAPRAGGEGLALLRDGEHVSTPGRGGDSGIHIHLHNPIIGGPRELADMIKEAQRRSYLPKGAVA